MKQKCGFSHGRLFSSMETAPLKTKTDFETAPLTIFCFFFFAAVCSLNAVWCPYRSCGNWLTPRHKNSPPRKGNSRMGARTTRKTSPSGSGSDLAKKNRIALWGSYMGAIVFERSIFLQREGCQCETGRFWELSGRRAFPKMCWLNFGALCPLSRQRAPKKTIDRSTSLCAKPYEAFFFFFLSVLRDAQHHWSACCNICREDELSVVCFLVRSYAHLVGNPPP